MAVMLDDLTLHGVSEPYRMLTARAEYRLRLRANNAASRLTPLGLAAGCIGPERAAWFAAREESRARLAEKLETPVLPSELIAHGVMVRGDGVRRALAEWLRFPEVTMAALAPWLGDEAIEHELADEMAEDAAYAPYLARQEAELRQLRASDGVRLGDHFPYGEVPGLSREMVERLERARPDTLAAAGRVPGITPAAMASLLVAARRRVAA